MLILTRKKGETIVIGDDVFVKVLSIDGDNVKIGIDAPDDVSIWREEIYEKIMLDKANSIGGEINGNR